MCKYVNLILKENLLGSPFVPPKKPILTLAGATLGSGILSGLGNIVSGLFGSSAQRSANESNRLIAQENRDWQSMENQKNRDYQTQMWNLQNEYNSPKNQRKLAEEAGYNPYLLSTQSLGSGAGSSGVPASQSAPNSPTMMPVNPMQGLGSGLGAIGDNVARFMQLYQQGEQVDSNVQLQRVQAQKAIFDMMMQAYKDGGQKQSDQVAEQFKPLMNAINWSGSYYDGLMKRKFLEMDISNDRQDIERSLLNLFGRDEYQKKLQLMDKEINVKMAEFKKLISEKNVNYKRIEELGSEMARNFAQAGLFGAQTSQITALLPYIRAILEDDSMRSMMDLDEKSADYVYGAKTRILKRSSYGQYENTVDFSSYHNPVFDFMRGLSKSLPISPVGGSYGSTTKYYGREGLNSSSNFRSEYINSQ